MSGSLRWTLLGLVLLGGSTCIGPDRGCEAEPLAQALDPASVGPWAVEFYLPAYRLAELGDELAAALADQGRNRLEAQLPALAASLDPTTQIELVPGPIAVLLDGIQVEAAQSDLQLTVGLLPAQVFATVEIRTAGQPTGTCTLELSVPQRVARLQLVLVDKDAGGADLVLDGPARLTGDPIGATVGPDCPVQIGGPFQLRVIEAAEQALVDALPALGQALAEVSARALGVDLGGAGRLGEDLSFQLWPTQPLSSFAEGRVRVGLAGGFESRRSPCVPADLNPLSPGGGQAAGFDELLPLGGQPYRLAVSVSLCFVHQGLVASHRAGRLCRRAGDGELVGIDLSDLLPSLRAFGPSEAVRVAVWPHGQIEFELELSAPEAGDNLPRVTLFWPDLHLDVFAELDGADLRVLGLRSDVTVVLAPRLVGHTLELRLADAELSGLEVEFAELLAEGANSLRAAVDSLAVQVAALLIDELGPIPLQLPAAAGDELLEYRVAGDHLLLYF